MNSAKRCKSKEIERSKKKKRKIEGKGGEGGDIDLR